MCKSALSGAHLYTVGEEVAEVPTNQPQTIDQDDHIKPNGLGVKAGWEWGMTFLINALTNKLACHQAGLFVAFEHEIDSPANLSNSSNGITMIIHDLETIPDPRLTNSLIDERRTNIQGKDCNHL